MFPQVAAWLHQPPLLDGSCFAQGWETVLCTYERRVCKWLYVWIF